MTQEQRQPGIDLMRGVCVLLVVLHHIHLRFLINRFEVKELLPEPVAKIIFWSGYFSVIAFFVISGFLITRLSLHRWGSLDQIDVRRFYWLRFTRIAPCLLLLVAVLSILHWMGASGFTIPPERASLTQTVFAALTFRINWLEGQRGYLPGAWDVLWSLSVEETFYLLFPLVCMTLRRTRWLVVAMSALLVAGPISRTLLVEQRPWGDYAYLSCADAIALGCLAALFAARVRPSRATLRAMMFAGLSCVLLIVVFRGATSATGLHDVGLGVSVLALGVASILVAMTHGVGANILERGTGLIRAIGRGSYEIYLTHMLVLMGLMPLIIASQPSIAIVPVWYGALLVLSVLLGLAVQRSFSEPTNAALRSRSFERSPAERLATHP